jgi:hypothetical protein
VSKAVRGDGRSPNVGAAGERVHVPHAAPDFIEEIEPRRHEKHEAGSGLPERSTQMRSEASILLSSLRAPESLRALVSSWFNFFLIEEAPAQNEANGCLGKDVEGENTPVQTKPTEISALPTVAARVRRKSRSGGRDQKRREKPPNCRERHVQVFRPGALCQEQGGRPKQAKVGRTEGKRCLLRSSFCFP